MKVLLPNFWKRAGLVLVIAQDVFSNEVLMVAFTNQAGYLETLQTGFAVYFSRSRWKRWKKGEESGNVQIVRQVFLNCDGSAVVYKVEQRGEGACHTNARSCFYRDCLGNQIMSAQKAGWKENLLCSGKILLPNFSKNFGVADVVVQNAATGKIIMAAATDKAGYHTAIETGLANYYYSAQHERWFKENPAGHTQTIRQILIDCDGDALVYKVACDGSDRHNGSESSFFRTFTGQQVAEAPLCAENQFTAETGVVDWLV